MSTAKTYYIEVKSSKCIADDLADYLENGPLYRDDDGTAEDATHQVVNLRAAAREALDVLTRLADAGLPVPLGAEVDEAKARLAGVLNG